MSVAGSAFDLKLFKKIFLYTKPYKSTLWLCIFMTLLLSVLGPVRPWLVQFALDHYVASKDASGLRYISIWLVVLLCFQTVMQYLYTYATNWLGQSVIRDIRVALYKHIIRLNNKFFDHTPIGTLITRTVSDIETIADVFSEGLIVIAGDLLQLMVIISFMFYYNWQLTLVALATLPILLLATRFFQKGIRESFKDVRIQVAALNTYVQEHITGMSLVQLFNRQQKSMEEFDAINLRHRKAHVKSVWYYSIFFPIVEILSAVSIGLVVWWGARGVLNETISVGVITAFIMYISMMFRPIRELADKFNTLQMGMVSSERIVKLLETDQQIINSGTSTPTVLNGDIEFSNVHFEYVPGEAILKGISFKHTSGKKLALVGATGAGKSSIIQLINRMYEFQSGTILIDGNDIRSYELNSLRSKIALVSQDVFLFSDSIYHNVSLRDESITLDQVVLAAKAIGVHDYINSLPGGYNFNVSERGALLSVGQRQLIAFLRAYVANPSILILDEASSSIDTTAERLIQEATFALTQGRTSVIVAHRLSTIQAADAILVLDKGKIVEQGKHEQLVANDGPYKKLFDAQFNN